ncbi:SGNH/GDSL hydrolase family protein [Pseudarthrobacter sp. J75]|uniref:SGNH/GDSL hydrolase family protein n=1 Tax=unclassified Pseudarthrobacter TaxID=2647000 RepID=UPI002E81E13D|nr:MULTISPECIES: SGNH/GDSL hydrolase family protein [unclassified Pseudarthrobacter]MEE2521277.1 SGNH/GDSL hydrolase family protein [Pseudarthrobacter sp. J47]MEE2528509.1 SGNH/GDSL hydrolase family protein [Pseudarthrobacter sp. J75]
MRNTPALARLAAPALAAIVLLVGSGAATPPVALPAAVAPAAPVHATGHPTPAPVPAPADEAPQTVLLIGDSQSEPADSWTRRGLAAAGYQVQFCGRGGTGFVAASSTADNYVKALRDGDWNLPTAAPDLIVIQGGGNDAAQGASDSQIAANADQLIAGLKQRYPESEMVMIGTLSRAANAGGGRRSQVDALLGQVAADHKLPFISVGDWLTRYGLAKDLADNVHMNAAGREALGTLLEGRLRDLDL